MAAMLIRSLYGSLTTNEKLLQSAPFSTGAERRQAEATDAAACSDSATQNVS